MSVRQRQEHRSWNLKWTFSNKHQSVFNWITPGALQSSGSTATCQGDHVIISFAHAPDCI